MIGSDFIIPKPQAIPYGGGEETNLRKYMNRSAKDNKMSKWRYFWVRLRNYFCCVTAMIMPSNKIRVALNRWKGVHVEKGAYIGMFCFIDNMHPEYIFIEKNVSINAGSYLVAHFNPMRHFRRTVLAQVAPIVVRQGAMVGMRAMLMPGVEVGEYAMVSSASVVYKNVAPKTIVRGNPAEAIGTVRLEKELDAELITYLESKKL
jgi:acetyltransferase-like isoleucine patch superfamily enzyme